MEDENGVVSIVWGSRLCVPCQQVWALICGQMSEVFKQGCDRLRLSFREALLVATLREP